MTEGMKPCPFCGGEACCSPSTESDETEREDREPLSWGVGCSCTAFVGPWSTEAEAITAWNTRVITDAMSADKAEIAVWREKAETFGAALAEKDAEIERLWEAITDLQAQVDQERAKVVEWLRNNAYSFRQPNAGLAMDAAYRAWREAADAIERGDYVS